MHWNNRQPTKIIIKVCIETSITLQIGLRAGCYDIDEQLIMTKVLICAIRSTSLQLIEGRLSALILLYYLFMFISSPGLGHSEGGRHRPLPGQFLWTRGAGGCRTLRDHKLKKHVTITTITKICSTLLLQLVAEVRQNLYIKLRKCQINRKLQRCSIRWLRCATTRTTGTPLSPLLGPCSGFPLFVKTSRFSQGPLLWHLK